ncbi:unnamed protein product, partial [Nesidiocoris tenuis]
MVLQTVRSPNAKAQGISMRSEQGASALCSYPCLDFLCHIVVSIVPNYLNSRHAGNSWLPILR